MKNFIALLQLHNGPLFIFGCFNMILAVIFLMFAQFTDVMVRGINTWYKPFKFALSIGVFSWTMGWYTYELGLPETVDLYNCITIALLGFEVVYIAFQAGRGQLSHYNVSSRLYSFLTVMMGVAAAIVTLWTGYIGLLFFSIQLPHLPLYYVVSIRIGIILFVIFAFEGAAMGARATHTVGGPEGGVTLPVLNWSTRFGDLRIAHFIGMHALQVLPLLSWYVLKNTPLVLIAGVLYALLAFYTLFWALKGKAVFKYQLYS